MTTSPDLPPAQPAAEPADPAGRAPATLLLRAAMPHDAPPEWPHARWVGAVDVAEVLPGRDIVLDDAAGYLRARLLVRDGACVRGFVDLPVTASRLDAAALLRDVARLPPARPGVEPDRWPSITVVVCTRDRPDQLTQMLPTLLTLDYPDFDIVVVDNAASNRDTATLIRREFAHPRLRHVDEPTPGLSHARNTGMVQARGEIVAFTDDDVAADRFWLRELARGFARHAGIDCVSGLVPSGELRARVQGYFDDRTSWSKNLESRVFSLTDPPADLPMFPFCVGQFGTGANFAVRRKAALELGGFDTALGVGTRSGGGEDLDFFTRLLLDGRALAMQPSAVIWHRHRGDLAALRDQAIGYGSGLGAWLAKLARDPSSLRMALARSPHALARLISMPWRKPAESVVAGRLADDDLDRALARVGWTELLAVTRGPWRYYSQRRADARAARR